MMVPVPVSATSWIPVGILAALSGFRPQVACRSSDYRFISALVGAGVGVALVSSLALTGSPQVRDLRIAPTLTRYIGAWLPRRHQPNPAAAQLLAALRAQPGRLRLRVARQRLTGRARATTSGRSHQAAGPAWARA